MLRRMNDGIRGRLADVSVRKCKFGIGRGLSWIGGSATASLDDWHVNAYRSEDVLRVARGGELP